jgi:hypothetical protein
MPHACDDSGMIGLNFHSPAAAVALLPAAKLAVDGLNRHGDACRESCHRGDETLPV